MNMKHLRSHIQLVRTISRSFQGSSTYERGYWLTKNFIQKSKFHPWAAYQKHSLYLGWKVLDSGQICWLTSRSISGCSGDFSSITQLSSAYKEPYWFMKKCLEGAQSQFCILTRDITSFTNQKQGLNWDRNLNPDSPQGPFRRFSGDFSCITWSHSHLKVFDIHVRS